MNFSFDATQHAPQYGGSSRFPVGQKMPGVITAAVIEPTNDGQNGKLVFTIEVIDGPNKGASGKDNLNLYHQNPQTVEIANKQLSAYCHVIGVYKTTNLNDFCGKPFLFDTRLQKEPNPQGYTEICALYDVHGNTPDKAGSGQQQGGNNGGQQNGPPAGFGASGNMPGNNPPAGVTGFQGGGNGGGNAGGGWGNQNGAQQGQQGNQNQGGNAWGGQGQQNDQQGQNGGNQQQGNGGGWGGGNGGGNAPWGR